MAVAHTINTDWVEVNLKCADAATFETVPEVCTNNGVTIFQKIGNGNKFYKNQWKVIHEQKEYGIMFSNSRSSDLIALDNFQFKVNNNKLYELGWLESMKKIMSASGMKYKSATRLDIALDGGDYFSVFEDWRKGKYDKVGKAKVTTHYNGKRKVEGYYIGMSKSKKKLVCYNKSEELKRTNKYYIEKFWRRCGLAPLNNIQRLELKIRNEENKKVKGMDFNKLDNFEHLASLMRTNLKGFFEFVLTDKHKNISRKKRIQPINWDAIGGALLEKDSTRNTAEVWSGKVTIKKLIEIHLITGKQFWYDAAFEIAMNIEHIEWLSKCLPEWKEKLIRKLGANRDGVITNNWITNFKEYGVNEQLKVFKE